MPPTLILIRHAEALHNATGNGELADPPLTGTGLQQCEDLQANLRKHCALAARVECIVSSPMRRTLQTTLLALKWLVEAGVPVEVDAMWQENSDRPCDTGSPLDRLTSAFPELDLSKVDPTYPDKSQGTPYAYTRAANHARGQACLRALYARPERVIAVVSHAGFLRTGVTHRRFANADYRIFTFARRPNGELELREDPQTEESGGGMRRSEKGIFAIRPDEFPDDTQEAR